MLAVVALAWLMLTGLGLVHRFLPSARNIEKLGLAFPLSAGLHGALFFVLMQGWKASVFWTCALTSPLLIVCCRIPFRKLVIISWKELLLVLWISVAGLQVFAHVVISPVVEWDALAMWIFKGKAIAIDGWISPQFLNWARHFQASYPWNVPMMHAWVARFTGHFSENATVWIYMIYFLSMLMILYSLARLYFARAASLLFIALYTAIPSTVSITFNRDADMILGSLIAAAMLLILRHQQRPSRGNCVLLGLTVFLCCWTKIEGLVFCGLLLLPYLILMHHRSQTPHNGGLVTANLGGCVIGFIAFFGPKHVFAAATYFASGMAPFGGFTAATEKAMGIVWFAGTELMHLRSWNLLWLLPVILIILKRDPFSMKWLLLAHVSVYLIVYFVTPLDWRWQMTTSFHRVLFHTVPVLYAWAVVACSGDNQTNGPKTLGFAARGERLGVHTGKA
ncbi:MAG TPA: glycosyltransferase family 39 protein [Acidobacteriota bacterium]|jgi:hypothetical protein